MNSSTPDFNDALVAFGTILAIPVIIFIATYILWLYFNIGTLTRLTDIKYNLEDIKNALERKQYQSADYSNEEYETTEQPEATEELALDDNSDTINLDFSSIKDDLVDNIKKPSKAFLIVMGVSIASFVGAMIFIYLNK